MTVRRRIVFTERELDVMAVLWQRGPSTVAEIRERIQDDLAYTTVLTVLQTLQAKGYVRPEAEGRAHRYTPLVTRHVAGRSAIDRISRAVFGGSMSLMLTHLVSDRRMSREKLLELRRLVDAQLRDRKRDDEGENGEGAGR